MGRANIARMVGIVALIATGAPIFAGSATWNSSPGSGNWNTSANWTPATVPNGSADTATFGSSSVTAISLSASTEVNSILFNSGASAYTITASPGFTFTISGTGITNNAGINENFAATVSGTAFGRIFFTNSATAGTLTTFTNAGSASNSVMSGQGFGVTNFFGTSSASSASFINNGGTVLQGFGGQTRFDNSSTASSGTFTNNGGTVAGSGGANSTFAGSSTAADAMIVNNGSALSNAGGGYTLFLDSSSAGAATLISNGGTSGGQGGTIYFSGNSTGGTSRVEVFGNGNLDITLMSAAGVTVGSIEGNGNIVLNNKVLTVGSNNMDTTFSGVISDGGFGGSLTKIGDGRLILSGANTYTGATTVNAGTLAVNGSVTSNITVNNGGTLGGSGTVQSITVNNGGTLDPGIHVGILFATGNLTLTLGAIYLVDLDGTAVGTQYDQTEVVGTVSLGNSTLMIAAGPGFASGTQFMIISNSLSDAVVGTFDGLPEGATFTADGGTTFMISYVGGNGNDVVLTVVPEPATWVLFFFGAALFCCTARCHILRN